MNNILAATDPSTAVFTLMSSLVIFAAILAGGALYFLPSVIALARHASNAGVVVVLNLFFGWSFIGWVVSLALAFASTNRPEHLFYPAYPQPAYPPQPYAPQPSYTPHSAAEVAPPVGRPLLAPLTPQDPHKTNMAAMPDNAESTSKVSG